MENMRDYRVVGNADDERKQAVKDELGITAKKDSMLGVTSELREKIVAVEQEKTKEMVEIIKFANDETNRLMVELGLEPIDVAPGNVHIIPQDVFLDFKSDFSGWADRSDISAFAETVNQSMYLNAEKTNGRRVNTAKLIFHEMLHIKGHLSVEVNLKPDGNSKTTKYREGLMINELQKDSDEEWYHTYFSGLDEAVISSQEKKLLANVGSHDVFQEDVKWMNSEEARGLKAEIALEENEPEDEIHWVDADGESYVLGGYEKYRTVFRYILEQIQEQIQEQFPDKYQNPDEVEKEFLKAHFTGHIVGIGRLVEKTFGKGAFRTLGHMRNEDDSDIFSSKIILEDLQSMRADFKK